VQNYVYGYRLSRLIVPLSCKQLALSCYIVGMPIRSIICKLLIAIAVVVCFATFLAFFNTQNWIAFLACQFRIQYLVILIIVAAVFAVLRKYCLSLICVIFAVINLLVLPGLFGSHSLEKEASHFRILQINVNYKNDDYSRVLNYIRKVNPDFLLLQEYTPEWKGALSSELSKQWPNKVEVVRTDTFGIAIFSRSKIQRHEIIQLGAYEWPSINCEVLVSNRSMKIFATHLMGPIPEKGWRIQNSQLEDLETRVKALPTLLVCGDFNMTPWTSRFQRLLVEDKLYDSRSGFGLQASWPSQRPILVSKLLKLPVRLELTGINWLVGLPLDQCLVTSDINILHREIGPNVGSDHFPVIVDIAK